MSRRARSRRTQLLEHHQTPLVIWSNRTGPAQDMGAVSPAFLPYHILTTAGIRHPYYTGFLGALRERYRVVDRNLLLTPAGEATPDWARQKTDRPGDQRFPPAAIRHDVRQAPRRARLLPRNGRQGVAHTS